MCKKTLHHCVNRVYTLCCSGPGELSTADGNGRMARLVMYHIQFESGPVPAKVLKEDKGERASEGISPFPEFMGQGKRNTPKAVSSNVCQPS